MTTKAVLNTEMDSSTLQKITQATTVKESLLKSGLYLVVLMGLLLTAYQVTIVLGGRTPLSPQEEQQEQLYAYILLAKQNGFGEMEIAQRLQESGWAEQQARQAIATACQKSKTAANAAQTLKKD